jgi:predicted MPP superfamily phosphohydrolase
MKQFLIFSAIILAIDLYAYQSIKTVLKNSSSKNLFTCLYFGFTVFSICFFVLSAVFDFRHHGNTLTKYLFGIIATVLFVKLLMIVFLLVEDIFRLGRTGIHLYHGNKEAITRSEFFNKIILGVAGLPLMAFIYGMAKGAYDYQTKLIKIKLKDLPADLEGLRIVQLSDIHSGSFTRKEPLISAVKSINDLNPDIFVFTGDLVNDFASEMDPYIEIFKEIKSKRGNYSVTGNHDYADYVPWDSLKAKQENFEQLKENHQKLGWKLLLNESVQISVGEAVLEIIGVENWGNNLRFKKYGKLAQAMSNTLPNSTKILLSHDPSHWEGEVQIKYPSIHLTLSGHTHGFQFGVETKYFKFSPSQWVYKQWAGLYEQGGQQLYVNRGFGFIGFPGRVGILPEITVLELTKA